MALPRFPIVLALALLLGSCGWVLPYPDYRLTHKDSAWGSVRRDIAHVLIRDYETHVHWSGLRQTSFPPMEELGTLPKGTKIQFTGFFVRRNYWGAQPYVYAKVLEGPNKDRTFDGTGLVVTSILPEKRQASIVRINEDAIKPLR